MATTVTMPQLGESVTEGTLARWLKQPGEAVSRFESIAEVVTDKVNAEIPSPTEGVMGAQLVKENTVVRVGEPLCSIEGADAASPAAPAAQASSAPAAASEAPSPGAAVPAAAPLPSAARPSAVAPIPSGMHLTPIVRTLIRENGLDAASLVGTGIGGRVTKKDVLDAVAARTGNGAAAPAAAPAEPPAAVLEPRFSLPEPVAASTPGRGDEVVPLNSVRRAIADHMVRSWHTSPHAWFMMEVNMQRVSALRDAKKREFRDRNGVDLTYLPFVARATIAALNRHPSMNASWGEQGIIEHSSVHLGIAVALEDNLIVPVVRDADRLSLKGLTIAMADVAERARTSRLKVDEIQGGTFTLNNTGALGTVLSAPIINQPQAAILAMDRVVKRVVVENDAIVIRPMMNLCISFDHRLNDGLQAARFLGSVKAGLEAMDEGDLA